MAIPQDALVPIPNTEPLIEGPIDEASELFEDDSAVEQSVDPVPVTTEEPVQVAGMWTAIGGAVAGAAKKVAKSIDEAEPIGAKPLEEPVTKVGDFWVVRESTDDEVRAFNAIIPDPDGKPPAVAINYDRMVGTGSELETFDRIAQVFDQ